MINTTKDLDINNTYLNDDNNNFLPQCYDNINNTKNMDIDLNIEHLNPEDTTDIINNRTLTFAKHNVHGLNNTVKNNQILETFINQQTDFVGLTETHHQL